MTTRNQDAGLTPTVGSASPFPSGRPATRRSLGQHCFFGRVNDRIAPDSMMIFEDRDAAGRALSAEVALRTAREAGQGRPLVLALSRGGVPVAVPVAARIGADLDLAYR